VAQMTKVYGKAQKLLIWLGDERRERAANLINLCAKLLENWGDPRGIKEPHSMHRQDWEAMRSHLDATWFQRVWV
jgi:hypothetical protein